MGDLATKSRAPEFLAAGRFPVTPASTGTTTCVTEVVVEYRGPVAATPLTALDRQITPADVFFARSHHGVPERCEPLAVDGRPIDLAPLEEVSVTAVLQCAGNGRALFDPSVAGLPWRYGGIGQATWTGVRLRDVLGASASAAHVWFGGADREYRCSLPLARALDPSTLLAYRMNGAAMRPEHGGALRRWCPGGPATTG